MEAPFFRLTSVLEDCASLDEASVVLAESLLDELSELGGDELQARASTANIKSEREIMTGKCTQFSGTMPVLDNNAGNIKATEKQPPPNQTKAAIHFDAASKATEKATTTTNKGELMSTIAWR